MTKMLVSTAVAKIKSAGHDISDEYTSEKCIGFINTAIQQVASLLISANWPAMVQEIIVRDGQTMPANYMKAAGTYPIRMTNGEAEIIDSNYDSVRFRYFATPDIVKSETDELPFNHDAVNDVVVKGAIILALNENEYDISQDSSLQQALQQAIASGMV